VWQTVRCVQTAAAVAGGFLNRAVPSELTEGQLLALLAVVVAGAVALVRFRPSARALRRAVTVSGVLYFAGAGVWAAVDFASYQDQCREHHVVEWLSAEMLLVGSLLALGVTIRQAARKRPCPIAMFLFGGLFWGFARELEWGMPFFGRKVIFSRNLFRLRAYIDPSYFDRFAEKVRLHNPPVPLWPAHLVFAGLTFGLAAVVAVYLVRHRKAFAAQLRAAVRQTYGRWFLLGAGAYVVAGLLGTVVDRVLKSESVSLSPKVVLLGHRAVSEPIELWGAACFLLAGVTLWHFCRGEAPCGRTAEQNASSSTPTTSASRQV